MKAYFLALFGIFVFGRSYAFFLGHLFYQQYPYYQPWQSTIMGQSNHLLPFPIFLGLLQENNLKLLIGSTTLKSFTKSLFLSFCINQHFFLLPFGKLITLDHYHLGRGSILILLEKALTVIQVFSFPAFNFSAQITICELIEYRFTIKVFLTAFILTM